MEIRINVIVAINLILVLLAVSITTASAISCDCGDICVNETGWWRDSGDFNSCGTSIQAAVDVATEGDTICVKDGTYEENVDVHERLTIRSENGSDSTTINSKTTGGSVFSVNTGHVSISGFTVKGAFYGIEISSSCNHNTLSNNIASDNTYGIYLSSSCYNTLSNNKASNNNVGIGVYSSSNNNTLMSNIANSNLHFGIHLSLSSSYNTLMGNTASNNGKSGIWLYRSSNYNTLSNNIASNNSDSGIYLQESGNQTLTGNIASNNSDSGIRLYYSSNNSLTGNTANENENNGIHLYSSSNNNFTSNIASNNDYGIQMFFSSNNTLTSNNANSNSYNGIHLYSSINNTLSNNTMSGNRYNFGAGGIHNIDTSNLVDGKPVYYWVNRKNQEVPDDAGYVGVVNCTNITVRDLILTNNSEGVLFAYTNNSRIENVTASNNGGGISLLLSSNNSLTSNSVSNNGAGIRLSYSSNNTLSNSTASNNSFGIWLRNSSKNNLTSNTASNNSFSGIWIYYSNNNLIYNNYFNNTDNARDDGSNRWNITKTAGTNIIDGPYLGGNYWSDYNGNDTDEDGIGDTLLPYNTGITIGGDWLPLMPTNVSVETSTGGTATFSTDSGQFADINGVDEDSLPQEAKENKPGGLALPHGLFNFTITDLTLGQSVTLTTTLPSPVPNGSLWWKVNTTAGNNTWYSLPIGDDDGDNVVTIALTDGGLGDNDGAANGVIVDPSSIGEVALPDLVIFDKWVNWPGNCTICYNVANTGDGTAPAGHNTTLYVDGVKVVYNNVTVELPPGESYIGCFVNYNWTYTPPEDNITVCADCNNTIAESNETNNCITNTWMCGDVNEDGTVNVLDVLGVYRRALDPGYPLDLPWAGDVNCDGAINVLDVLGVYRRALDPGYDLGCCCG